MVYKNSHNFTIYQNANKIFKQIKKSQLFTLSSETLKSNPLYENLI